VQNMVKSSHFNYIAFFQAPLLQNVNSEVVQAKRAGIFSHFSTVNGRKGQNDLNCTWAYQKSEGIGERA